MKWLSEAIREDIASSPVSEALIEKLWWKIGEASPYAQKYTDKFFSAAFPSNP